MSEYNLFAGVDENFRFPPEVRAALLESLNIRNVGAPMTTAERNAIPTAELESGYYIFNTQTQGYQVWRADFEEWHDGLESPGSQKWWPGPTIPAGWKKQNGASLPRTTFFALFAAIQTTYGGSTTPTHFNPPNTSGRTPIDANAAHPLGQQGGKESVKLEVSHLPKHRATGTTDITEQSHQHGGTTEAGGDHTHGYWWVTTGSFNATGGGPAENAVYRASRTYTSTGTADIGHHAHNFATDWRSTSHSHPFTSNEIGSDAEHENMMPFQAGHFIIKY